MAATLRRPMLPRTVPQISLGITPSTRSPLKPTARNISGSKRPHSPDQSMESAATRSKTKRVRAANTKEERAAKEQRQLEREAQLAEFKERYTKAFPSWVFYFDLDSMDGECAKAADILASKIVHLKARVDDFFSNEITHLITNHPVPKDDADKENHARGARTLKVVGHANHRGPVRDDLAPTFDLTEKALSFGMKIWPITKLESVLDRCLTPMDAASHKLSMSALLPVTSQQRSLTRLLECERLYGATSERDPTQKRHDYRYFPKSNYFILVEDMRGELATLVAFEYSSKGQPTWPVLHCHPYARGPFMPFDEHDMKRHQRSLAKEKEHEQSVAQNRHQDFKRKAAERSQATKGGDLRRTVSMISLRQNAGKEGWVDLDADIGDTLGSANASGYLGSGAATGYIAASGNSVGITSTTGTTSTAGFIGRTLQSLPPALRGKIDNHIVTSRRVSVPAPQGSQKTTTMGPPVEIPKKPFTGLRKSRSTNTLRLPKREEGVKPGYCESCRVKFEDFAKHARGHRHRKYAMDDSNFLQLDFVLSRVRRRTIEEMQTERQIREKRRHDCPDDAAEASQHAGGVPFPGFHPT